MLQTVHRPIINTYPVEASGWDREQVFFVEKSELEWNEETGKYLTLNHSLGDRKSTRLNSSHRH